MTLQLALSQIKAFPYDFHKEVEAFRQAKLAHRSTQGQPAPSAISHLVEAAIKRVPAESGPDDFVADYEIVDDTPPPPTLDEQKAKLAAELGTRANALCDAIEPPLKRRLWNIEAARAAAVEPDKRLAADNAVLAEHATRRARIEAVHHHLAKLESEIHDLTAETIGGWKPAPFPGE